MKLVAKSLCRNKSTGSIVATCVKVTASGCLPSYGARPMGKEAAPCRTILVRFGSSCGRTAIAPRDKSNSIGSGAIKSAAAGGADVGTRVAAGQRTSIRFRCRTATSVIGWLLSRNVSASHTKQLQIIADGLTVTGSVCKSRVGYLSPPSWPDIAPRWRLCWKQSCNSMTFVWRNRESSPVVHLRMVEWI